jgi:hypothetical protein
MAFFIHIHFLPSKTPFALKYLPSCCISKPESLKFSLKFVLAQAHRDPLIKIKGLRKIECFSEKRFKELKRAIKELVFIKREEDTICGRTGEILHRKRSERNERECRDTSYDFILTWNNRERVWWDKENWKDIEDIENPWGELSWSEEYFLKKILKGKV